MELWNCGIAELGNWEGVEVKVRVKVKVKAKVRVKVKVKREDKK